MCSSALGSAASAAVLVALLAAPGSATPTGLNNIPTADVVDTRLLVLQGFSQFGEGRYPTWFAGLKYGPADNWELGLDDAFAGPASSTGPALQLKYRLRLPNEVGLAFGAANISGHTDRNGEVFPYAVVSSPPGRLRGHLGYSAQADNNAWFFGVDGPIGGGVTVRADWIQVEDGEESIAGLGFLTALSPRWLIEAWASFPTAEEAATEIILKLDFVVPGQRS